MIAESLRAAAKKMMIDFEEVTSLLNHNGEKGTSREEIFISYLGKYIPRKFEIGRGIILDSLYEQSKQQDCIIYDAFTSPVLINLESTKMIPIESIYCVIEIKSSLDKDELYKCVKNIESVRKLKKNTLNNIITPTAGFVFSFTSETSIESLMKNLCEFNKLVEPSNRISAICILDKGLIVNLSKDNMQRIQIFPDDSTALAIVKNLNESNLLLFYLVLMQYLNSTHVSSPDLFKYCDKYISNNIQYIIPKELWPTGGYIDLEGRKVSLDEIKSLSDKQDYLAKITSGKSDINEIMDFFSTILVDYFILNTKATGNLTRTFVFFGKTYDVFEIFLMADLYKKVNTKTNIDDSDLEKLNKFMEEISLVYKEYFKDKK